MTDAARLGAGQQAQRPGRRPWSGAATKTEGGSQQKQLLLKEQDITRDVWGLYWHMEIKRNWWIWDNLGSFLAYGGFHRYGNSPIYGWFTRENPTNSRMMTGGSLILGKPPYGPERKRDPEKNWELMIRNWGYLLLNLDLDHLVSMFSALGILTLLKGGVYLGWMAVCLHKRFLSMISCAVPCYPMLMMSWTQTCQSVAKEKVRLACCSSLRSVRLMVKWWTKCDPKVTQWRTMVKHVFCLQPIAVAWDCLRP